MLKKSLFFASIASLGLAFSSCSSDIEAPVAGQDGMVVFTAKMPGSINSRAYSDGTGADQLQYAVYKAETDDIVYASTQLDAPKAVYNNDLTFTLQLPLVKGQSYDLIFWAEKTGNKAYTFAPETKTVSIDYEGIESNDETRDAFFTAEKGLNVTGAMEKNIQLYRPFAQLNIGTNDLEVAERAGITLGTTQVVVKDVYSTLNLFSGEASGETEVTYAYAELPNAGKQASDAGYEAFPVNGYEYLSMNYILTGEQILDENVNSAQKETKDITIAILDKDDKSVNEFNVSAVPFQRNFRTNIYGALLTSTVDFVIEVVPDYNDPDKNLEVSDVPEGKIKFNGKLYESITAAIAAATADDTEATLYVGEGKYDASEISVPSSNPIAKLTIVGVGNKTIFNKNAGQNVKSNIDLTFKSLAIKTNASNYNGFYHSGSETYEACEIENALFLYGTTANFKDCTFTVADDKLASSYNVWCYGAKAVTFESCEFNAAKSILVYCENASMSQTVNVKDCVFNGSELKDGKAAIEVDCHRLGADYSYTINLDNSKASGFDGGNLSGKQLWNVKDGEKFKIYENGVEVIQGITTPDRTGNLYHVNSVEGLERVSALVKNGYYKDAILTSETYKGKTLMLTTDLDLGNRDWTPIGTNNQGKDKNTMNWFEGTFDGDGHTISNLKCYDEGNYAVAGLFGAIRGNIKNLTIDGADIKSTHYAGALVAYAHNNNASTYNDKNYPSAGFFIENCIVRNAKIVTTPNKQANGSYDNGDKAGVLIGYTNTIMTITGCEISNSSVEAYRDLGALIGYIGGSKAGNLPIKIDSNKATNIQLLQNLNNGYKAVSDVVERHGTWYGWKDFEPASCNNNIENNITYKSFIADGVTLNSDDNYVVTEVAGLTWMSNAIMTNTIKGKTIELGQDIDATGLTLSSKWAGQQFNGSTLDGKGHTISNLNIVNGILPGGPHQNSTIKNLTLKDCKAVNGGGLNGTGMLYGQLYGNVTIENVHIDGGSVEGVFAVGAFIGQLTCEESGYTATIKNCSVKNVDLKAIGNINGGWIEAAGIGGANAMIGCAIQWWNPAKIVSEENIVEGCTYSNKGDVVGGGLYSIAQMDMDKYNETPRVIAVKNIDIVK